MKIKLSEDYVLCSDKYCYWVGKIRKNAKPNAKKDHDVVSGYYATLDKVIKSYIDENIKTSEAEELKALNQEIEDLKKTIEEWDIRLPVLPQKGE